MATVVSNNKEMKYEIYMGIHYYSNAVHFGVLKINMPDSDISKYIYLSGIKMSKDYGINIEIATYENGDDNIFGSATIRFTERNNFFKLKGVFTSSINATPLSITFQCERVTGNPFLSMKSLLPDNVVKIEAHEFDDFKDGLAILRKGDKYSIVNKYGEIVIPWGKYKFNKMRENTIDKELCGFYNGITVVRDPETEMYGFLNKKGQLIVPCVLTDAGHFQEDGYGWGKIEDDVGSVSYFYFDTLGRKFKAISNGFDGRPVTDKWMVSVKNNDGYTSFYRKNGKFVFKTKKKVAGPYSDGLIRVDTVYKLAGYKTGFIDTMDRLVIPYRKEKIDDFYNGFAIISNPEMQQYQYGFLDHDNQTQIVLKENDQFSNYYNVSNFSSRISDTSAISILSVESKKGTSQKAWLNKRGEISILEQELIDNNWVSIKLYGIEEKNITVPSIFFESPTLIPFLVNYSYYMPKDFVTGGFNGGQLIKTTRIEHASCFGITDLYGNVKVQPIFKSINRIDLISRLMKAQFVKEGEFIDDPRAPSNDEVIDGYINENGKFIIVIIKPM